MPSGAADSFLEKPAVDAGKVLPGMAQYRMKKYQEAVDTLSKADRLNATDRISPPPAILAFLAMAQHQLGQTKEAQVALGRLQLITKELESAKGEAAQGFLHEAEAVLQAKKM